MMISVRSKGKDAGIFAAFYCFLTDDGFIIYVRLLVIRDKPPLRDSLCVD